MKYIDAERLSKKIERIGLFPQRSADYNDGRIHMKMIVLGLIDSLQQETPQGWISVKDRLPDSTEHVLTCINQGGVPQCLGFHYYLDGRWWDDDDDFNEPYNGALDYWMPIPKFKEK